MTITPKYDLRDNIFFINSTGNIQSAHITAITTISSVCTKVTTDIIYRVSAGDQRIKEANVFATKTDAANHWLSQQDLEIGIK